MEDVVYFELNNWFSGRDYPNAEPFLTWCKNDLNLYFSNDEFVKQNRLCVVMQNIDMSVNWCITAPKSFVLENCPKLLSGETTKSSLVTRSSAGTVRTDEDVPYSRFLRFPDEYGEVYGRFGTEFLPYADENIGITFLDDED